MTKKTIKPPQKKAVNSNNMSKPTEKKVKKSAAKATIPKKPKAKKTKKVTTSAKNTKRVASKKVKAAPSLRKKQTQKSGIISPLLTFQPMETMMNKNTSQFDQFEKIAQSTNDFSREGYEAFQKSMTILAQKSEEIVKIAVAIAQSSAERHQKLMQDAMTSKTLNEWADTQSKMAQASFDDFMSGATKISELGVKALTECSEPINQQMTKVMNQATDAVQKTKKAASDRPKNIFF